MVKAIIHFFHIFCQENEPYRIKNKHSFSYFFLLLLKKKSRKSKHQAGKQSKPVNTWSNPLIMTLMGINIFSQKDTQWNRYKNHIAKIHTAYKRILPIKGHDTSIIQKAHSRCEIPIKVFPVSQYLPSQCKTAAYRNDKSKKQQRYRNPARQLPCKFSEKRRFQTINRQIIIFCKIDIRSL